jgi:predicted branched-subunit amino acid permease
VITAGSKETVYARARAALVPPFAPDSFRTGVREMAPLAVAIAAWGVVTGVAMVKGGLSVGMALTLTFVAFAGSAQLAVLPLLMVSAPLPVVWITATMVNLRFVIFSAASRRYFSALPWPQRLFSSYLNGDVGFALFARRFGDDTECGTPEQWGFFFGGAAVNWVTWQAASCLGIVLGGLLPSDWGFELAASLALVAVVIPMASRAPAVVGVIVTGVLSVITINVPYRLGVVMSVLAGVAVAMLAEPFDRQRSRGEKVDA